MRSKVCLASGGCSRHRIDVPPTVFRYERASCSSPERRIGMPVAELGGHVLPLDRRPLAHLLSGESQAMTEYRCQVPGTPLSLCSPRSSNSIPEPATRSVTVRDTSTSPAAASADTLAPM